MPKNNANRKIRISKPLPDNMATTIHRLKKQNMETVPDPAIWEAARNKFALKKFESITTLEAAMKNGCITYWSAKKRDLGCDKLEVRVVANQYITTVFTPSSHPVSGDCLFKQYYEIL